MGQIELITGGMFCGKTEELLRRIRREMLAGKKVQLFKPKIDTRYELNAITSHNHVKLPAIPVDSVREIRRHLRGSVEVIGLDEIQFLDDSIIEFCLERVQKGQKVIASALALDFRGEPFKFRDSNRHIGELMPYAINTTLRAICTYKINGDTICGAEADRTQRLINGKPAPYDSPLILIGSSECYEARCRKHHIVPKKAEDGRKGGNKRF